MQLKYMMLLNQSSNIVNLVFLHFLFISSQGGPVTEPTETPTTGYFAPSNQPVDIPDFSWRVRLSLIHRFSSFWFTCMALYRQSVLCFNSLHNHATSSSSLCTHLFSSLSQTFPTGSSAMEHRPWVQPKVPTGPIVLPNSASVGPQYVGVMLPQPILPFANEYISYPQMPEGGSNLTPYQDFTGRLAPPIFLETDVEITAETEAELEQEADADAEADESLEESTEES